MRILIFLVTALFTIASYSQTVNGLFLYDSYIRFLTEDVSPDSNFVYYEKYDFNFNGSGVETHVQLSIDNGKPVVESETYPLSWEMDNTVLTIKTKTHDDIEKIKKYYLQNCGQYLEQVIGSESILTTYKIYFTACSPSFGNPGYLQHNKHSIKSFITELNQSKANRKTYRWPWYSTEESGWNSGIYTIEKRYTDSNNKCVRIIVSKNNLTYTLVAPPEKPHSPKSQVYYSWNILSRMLPGQKIALRLKEIYPLMTGVTEFLPESSSSDAYMTMIPFCGESKVHSCDGRVFGMFYGLIDNNSDNNLSSANDNDKPLYAYYYAVPTSPYPMSAVNHNYLYVLYGNNKGYLMTSVTGRYFIDGNFDDEPGMAYRLNWKKKKDLIIIDLFIGDEMVDRQFFKQTQDNDTLYQINEYPGMKTIQLSRIPYSSVLDGTFYEKGKRLID